MILNKERPSVDAACLGSNFQLVQERSADDADAAGYDTMASVSSDIVRGTNRTSLLIAISNEMTDGVMR